MIALRSRARRAGILLETVVSLALFVGVGSFVLAALRQANDAAERVLLETRAMDLAATTLAELEAGVITLADLRGEIDLERPEFDDPLADDPGEEPRLRVEADTARTQWDGLVEVTVRVFDTQPSAELVLSEGGFAELRLVELRQLVATRLIGESEFDEDDLLRGLPEEGDDPFGDRSGGGGAP